MEGWKQGRGMGGKWGCAWGYVLHGRDEWAFMVYKGNISAWLGRRTLMSSRVFLSRLNTAY